MASHGESKIPGANKDPRRSFLPPSSKRHPKSHPPTATTTTAALSSSGSPDSKTASDAQNNLRVGERVSISGVKYGYIRYLGDVCFAEGTWCGIELDEPDGKHNGIIQGIRYFECIDRYGIFAPLYKVYALKDYVEDIPEETEPSPEESPKRAIPDVLSKPQIPEALKTRLQAPKARGLALPKTKSGLKTPGVIVSALKAHDSKLSSPESGAVDDHSKSPSKISKLKSTVKSPSGSGIPKFDSRASSSRESSQEKEIPEKRSKTHHHFGSRLPTKSPTKSLSDPHSDVVSSLLAKQQENQEKQRESSLNSTFVCDTSRDGQGNQNDTFSLEKDSEKKDDENEKEEDYDDDDDSLVETLKHNRVSALNALTLTFVREQSYDSIDLDQSKPDVYVTSTSTPPPQQQLPDLTAKSLNLTFTARSPNKNQSDLIPDLEKTQLLSPIPDLLPPSALLAVARDSEEAGGEGMSELEESLKFLEGSQLLSERSDLDILGSELLDQVSLLPEGYENNVDSTKENLELMEKELDQITSPAGVSTPDVDLSSVTSPSGASDNQGGESANVNGVGDFKPDVACTSTPIVKAPMVAREQLPSFIAMNYDTSPVDPKGMEIQTELFTMEGESIKSEKAELSISTQGEKTSITSEKMNNVSKTSTHDEQDISHGSQHDAVAMAIGKNVEDEDEEDVTLDNTSFVKEDGEALEAVTIEAEVAAQLTDDEEAAQEEEGKVEEDLTEPVSELAELPPWGPVKDRPLSMVSTSSTDTGYQGEIEHEGIPGLPEQRPLKERPISLISTSSADTGFQPDLDNQALLSPPAAAPPPIPVPAEEEHPSAGHPTQPSSSLTEQEPSGPVKSEEIQEEVPAAVAAEVVDNQEQEQQGKAEIPATKAEQQPAAAEIVVEDREPVQQAAEPEEAKEEELDEANRFYGDLSIPVDETSGTESQGQEDDDDPPETKQPKPAPHTDTPLQHPAPTTHTDAPTQPDYPTQPKDLSSTFTDPQPSTSGQDYAHSDDSLEESSQTKEEEEEKEKEEEEINLSAESEITLSASSSLLVASGDMSISTIKDSATENLSAESEITLSTVSSLMVSSGDMSGSTIKDSGSEKNKEQAVLEKSDDAPALVHIEIVGRETSSTSLGKESENQDEEMQPEEPALIIEDAKEKVKEGESKDKPSARKESTGKPSSHSKFMKPKMSDGKNAPSTPGRKTSLNTTATKTPLKKTGKVETTNKKEIKRPNTTKVTSKIGDYLKKPPLNKNKDNESNNPKISKDVTNKKKAETNNPSLDKKKISSPRIDPKEKRVSVVGRVEMGKMDAKTAKRHPPKSKWDNIMSQINTSKDSTTVKNEPKGKSTNPGTTNPKNKNTEEGKKDGPRARPGSGSRKLSSPAPVSRTLGSNRKVSKPTLELLGGGKKDGADSVGGGSGMSSARSSRSDLSNVGIKATRNEKRMSLSNRTGRPLVKPSNRTASNLRHEKSPSSASIRSDGSQGSTSKARTESTPRGGRPGTTGTAAAAAKRKSLIEPGNRRLVPPEPRRASMAGPPSGRTKKEGPSAASTPKRPSNQNKNKTKAGVVGEGKERQLKNAHQPDLVTNSIAPNAAKEISRLEALCESRTKELKFLQMQLKEGVAGFDAMSVLVNYLVQELNAFSCPAVTANLQKSEDSLAKTQGELLEERERTNNLQEDIVRISQEHAHKIDTLIAEHKKNITAMEDRLIQIRKEEITKLIDQHSKDITALKNYHDRQINEVEKSHDMKCKELQRKHMECEEQVHIKHKNRIDDLQRQHESKLEDITNRFESIKLTLSEKVEILRSECEEMKRREQEYLDAFQRDSDSKVQHALAPYKHLPQEIESLKCVLEMKNHEVHELRRQKLEVEKELEDLPKAQEKVKRLEQKVENLEAIINIKSDYERQLSEKHHVLLRKYDKESRQKKRLSMDNEELQWRLQDIPSPDSFHRQFSRSPTGSDCGSPDPTRKPSPNRNPSGNDLSFSRSPVHRREKVIHRKSGSDYRRSGSDFDRKSHLTPQKADTKRPLSCPSENGEEDGRFATL